MHIDIKLHAVSRTQQGRQKEPSVKTLRSPQPRYKVRYKGRINRF